MNLRELGVTKERLPGIVQSTVVMQGGYQALGSEEIFGILEKAYKGWKDGISGPGYWRLRLLKNSAEGGEGSRAKPLWGAGAKPFARRGPYVVTLSRQ